MKNAKMVAYIYPMILSATAVGNKNKYIQIQLQRLVVSPI